MTYWKRGESKIYEPLSLFDEAIVTNRTNLIEIKSQTNQISQLRNITDVSGTAAISIADSEYSLSTGATAGSAAVLSSAERGRYQPGYGAQVGIAGRVPDSNVFAGTAEVRWGYYDDNHGFGFGKDATGLFIFIRKNGTETKTYSSNWNIDRADGSGGENNPSGITLDGNRGNIYQIDFAWYGYGNIVFKAVVPSGNTASRQQTVSLHYISPNGETSITQPNLPIRAELTNGDQTTDYDVYVAGRQYSIIGKYSPNRRLTSHTITAQGVTDAAGWEPVMSFRRKAGDSFDATSAKLAYLQVISDVNCVARLKTGATLGTPSWGTPSGKTGTANETALEVDTSATVSGGIVLCEFLIEGGRASSDTASFFGEDFNFDLIEFDAITLEVNALATGTLAAVNVTMREDW